MTPNHLSIQASLQEQSTPHICITVVGRRGSVPQDLGAKAIVTSSGLHWGTVGGGKVEAYAITRALELLHSEGASVSIETIKLNRDLGMTCGGEIRLLFEAYDCRADWSIAVFGAGHIGCALVETLTRMRCRVRCYDDREEWLSRLPSSQNVSAVLSDNMPGEIKSLSDSTQVVLMTKGHGSDLPILRKALEEKRFPFVGVIGSRSKAERLRKALAEQGVPQELIDGFQCPLGLPVGSNDPVEISLSIACQLMWNRDTNEGIPIANKWLGQTTLESVWAD